MIKVSKSAVFFWKLRQSSGTGNCAPEIPQRIPLRLPRASAGRRATSSRFGVPLMGLRCGVFGVPRSGVSIRRARETSISLDFQGKKPSNLTMGREKIDFCANTCVFGKIYGQSFKRHKYLHKSRFYLVPLSSLRVFLPWKYLCGSHERRPAGARHPRGSVSH